MADHMSWKTAVTNMRIDVIGSISGQFLRLDQQFQLDSQFPQLLSQQFQ